MTLYAVHYYHQTDGSRGYEWFASRRAAERSANEWKRGDAKLRAPEVDAYIITPTRAGILRALNAHASHPNNG